MGDQPATRASLLVRLRDRQDELAWNEFVELYTPLVYGYARRQGLQDADAADLSQEVLLAVAGAVKRLEYDPRRGAFRNWLFTIVRRRLASWRLGQRREPCGRGEATVQPFLEDHPDPNNIDAVWEAEWDRRLFAWACEQVRLVVSEATWQAFWRTAVEREPGKQVAAELGLTVAAVYLSRRRVLAKLKELVQSVAEN